MCCCYSRYIFRVRLHDKKIYYAYDNKVRSSNISKFWNVFDSVKDCLKGLSFQSNYNQNTFEPDVELDIELNLRYTKLNEIIKCSIILKTDLDSKKDYDIYNSIIGIFAQHRGLMVSGYSYYLENNYGPVSISNGIIRKNSTPDELRKLASFYHLSTVDYTTIGLFNCFSNLNLSEINSLKSIFGESEVKTMNSITSFYNRFLESGSMQEFIKSEKAHELSVLLKDKLN